MRLGTTFVLVALAHVLVIVLLLSHFGWPGSADSEGDTDSISGQSGIVIPVTLEKAEDPEPISTPEAEAKAETTSQPEPEPEPDPEPRAQPEAEPTPEPQSEEETTQPENANNETDKELVLENDSDAAPKPAATEPDEPKPSEPKPTEPAPAAPATPAPPSAPTSSPTSSPSTSPATTPSTAPTDSSTSASGSGPALISEPHESHPETPAQVDPNYLHRPSPIYPAQSRRLREEGTVVLRVSLDARGTVQDIAIQTSSTFERLDQAALEAVRQWRFVPATRGQTAVPSTVLVPIAFRNQ